MTNPRTLAVAALSVLLVGCATTQHRSPIPYALTGSEITVVENSIRSVRRDLNNADFRDFRAAQHEDGQIDVCGWIRLSGSTSEQPYIGTLFGGPCAPECFGGNQADKAQL